VGRYSGRSSLETGILRLAGRAGAPDLCENVA
jgi:hypothetical protein